LVNPLIRPSGTFSPRRRVFQVRWRERCEVRGLRFEVLRLELAAHRDDIIGCVGCGVFLINSEAANFCSLQSMVVCRIQV
jgi:hypothetical protein